MYSELIENRPVAYEALFLGELPYDPQPDEVDIGLSGLWRVYTPKKGRNGDELNEKMEDISAQVHSVLLEHDVAAHGTTEAAVFGLIDRQTTLPVITNITVQAFQLWEKALWRNHYDSIIPTNGSRPMKPEKATDHPKERLANLLAEKSLVVETAAAAMQILPTFVKNSVHPTLAEQAGLAKVIANWGPQFLVEWMNGSIISRWLNENNLDSSEKIGLLSTFTPAIRKHLAVHNIGDPLAALDRVKVNLELLGDDKSLAERLGWSIEDVASTFTPAIRKHLAVHNIGDPLAGATEHIKGKIQISGRYFAGR